MRHPRCLSHAIVLLGCAWLAILVPARPAAADGLLGVFLDRDASDCNLIVPSAGSATVYVVFLPGGSTSGGITGAEFRIDHAAAGSYVLQNEHSEAPVWFGSALGSGVNTAFTGCQGGLAVPLLRFQMLNPGGGSADVEIRIGPRQPPSNAFFPCPLVTLCNEPAYTAVCVTPGKSIVNPSRPRPCGSSREAANWGQVKDLYR